MIICSCNVLTKRRIIEIAAGLAKAEPDRPVTPARLFKALDVRPQCGTCFATVRKVVAASGIDITCPEPLASSADEDVDYALSRLGIAVDDAGQPD